jgi:uncharacterized protein (TIGR04255 family)
MPGTADPPFGVEPVDAIPLDPPPLARVLAQVRFSPVLEAADELMAGRVQRSLVSDYPLVRGDVEFAFAIQGDPGIPPAPSPSRIWRYGDADDSWRVSLATNFVALECAAYPGHEVFYERLHRVLTTVSDVVAPSRVERTGVRYVQRLAEPSDLARLSEFVRPEVAGMCSVETGDANMVLCLTQTQVTLTDIQISARWGMLPPGTTVDPVIAPMDAPSWLLDIDVFDEHHEPFDAAALTARALSHSRHQYRFFRWAVEPAFLLRFGADPALVAALDAY